VYRGSSPGYVPTAYPQIARTLDDLANSIPDELNLEVEKGYTLTTDGVYATDYDITSYDVAFMFGGMILIGAGAALYTYYQTGDPLKAFACGVVMAGSIYLYALFAMTFGGPMWWDNWSDMALNIYDVWASLGICADY